MTYGMKMFHTTGTLAYSTDDVTWNQVDFFQVSANSSASNDYPVMSGMETLVTQMFINPPPSNMRAYAHTVTVTGTNVSVSGGNQDTLILVLAR